MCTGALSNHHGDATGLQLHGQKRGSSVDIWAAGGEHRVRGEKLNNRDLITGFHSFIAHSSPPGRYVIEPYHKYPNLLDILFSFLKSEQPTGIRREVRHHTYLSALCNCLPALSAGVGGTCARPPRGSGSLQAQAAAEEPPAQQDGDTS